jgi:hypothetical protein
MDWRVPTSGKDSGVVVGFESPVVGRCSAQLCGPSVDLLAVFVYKMDDERVVLTPLGFEVPIGNIPSTVEPSVFCSKNIVSPPPTALDFAGDVAMFVPLLPGPSIAISGGNDCRPGGMPRLVRQVGINKGFVADPICLSNVDMRAKLVPLPTEVKISPGLNVDRFVPFPSKEVLSSTLRTCCLT